MNSILKATQSYYLSQRDILLADLENLLNRGSHENITQKSIEIIQKLALTNVCLNTVEAIIQDNSTSMSLGELSDLISRGIGQPIGENSIPEEDKNEKNK